MSIGGSFTYFPIKFWNVIGFPFSSEGAHGYILLSMLLNILADWHLTKGSKDASLNKTERSAPEYPSVTDAMYLYKTIITRYLIDLNCLE